MRKIVGIPLVLLGILIGVGIAVAAFYYMHVVKPTVQGPVSENYTKTFNLESGDIISETKELDLSLPGIYDLAYRLTGDDNDLLKGESATITLDTDDDGDYAGEPWETINNIGGTVAFWGVSGQICQKITIRATARDRVILRVKWADGNRELATDITSTLVVSMEPTRV